MSLVPTIDVRLACPRHLHARLGWTLDSLAAWMGIQLRFLLPDQPGESERLLVVGEEGQEQERARLILRLPCQLDQADARLLEDRVTPGGIPVFGHCERFEAVEGLPWTYRDGSSPISWSQHGTQVRVRLGFDPLGPLFRQLSREEERGSGDKRAFVEGLSTASEASSAELVDHPWGDRLAQVLARLLDLPEPDDGRSGPLARWPEGKRWALCLGHDVDMLFKWRFRSALRLLLESPLYVFRGRFRLLARQWRELYRKLAEGEDPWFLVEEMIDLEKRRGLVSTFFFLAESHDHKTYRYHLYKAAVRALLSRVREAGFELALHGGWYSFADREKLQDQKVMLDRCAGIESDVTRQHYLRFDPSRSWVDQLVCGFGTDSSLGWNDRPGFRAGTSLPFFPWDPAEQEALPILELPLVLMDSQFYFDGPLQEREAAEQIRSLVDILARSGGLLTANWHPHVLCEADFPGLRGLYEGLLEEALAKDPHVDTAGGIAARWRRREAYRRGELP